MDEARRNELEELVREHPAQVLAFVQLNTVFKSLSTDDLWYIRDLVVQVVNGGGSQVHEELLFELDSPWNS